MKIDGPINQLPAWVTWLIGILGTILLALSCWTAARLESLSRGQSELREEMGIIRERVDTARDMAARLRDIELRLVKIESRVP